MFFGAGNLVYPLYIGVETSPEFYASIAGIMLTGVFLPFLGLVGALLYEGDVNRFFSGLGRYTSLVLIVIILALIGPIAAIPRCVVVSFGSFQALLKNLDLFWFDLFFCFLLLFSVWNKDQVMELIGKWLTPILIIGVAVIISCALLDKSSNLVIEGDISVLSAFLIAAENGYQTMDLCAAIFFGVIAYESIKNMNGTKSIFCSGIISFSIGMFLLFLVYAFFVYIGAKNSNILIDVARENMLSVVVHRVIGSSYTAIVLAITVFLACLTTAIALVDLVANWLSNSLNFIKRKYAVIIIVFLSFIFALFGFTGLTNFLSIALLFLYPALVAVTIAAIFDSIFNIKVVKYVFWIVCCLNLAYNSLL